MNLDEIREEKKKNILNKIPDGTQIIKTIIPLEKKYFLDSSGFGIFSCVYSDDENKKNKFIIKGTFLSPLTIGQTYEVKGKIVTYKSFFGVEKQISVSNIKEIIPTNKKGIISYLQTLKGLKTKAEVIYEVYGDKSIEILRDNPMEVAKNIKGIGPKTALTWSKELNKTKDTQDAMTKLLGYGLTINQSKILYDEYGIEIINIIEDDPYFLAKVVRGFGFKLCDKIAINMGFDLKSKFRIHEAIINVLEEASFEGNCYLPVEVLIDKTLNLLKYRLSIEEMIKLSKSNKKEEEYYIGKNKCIIDILYLKELLKLYKNERNIRKKEQYRYVAIDFEDNEVVLRLEELALERRISKEMRDKNEVRIYLTNLYYDELKVTHRTLLLSQETPFNNNFNIEKELDKYTKENNIKLEDKQKQSIIEFAKNKGGFFLLLGSAGCGKTFTIKILLKMLELNFKASNERLKVKIFAPTGKAAKVAAKATGLPCSTIHRGLGFNPVDGFEYNENNPLEANVIVVDESSMLDITLTKYLLNAISNGTKIIFLGDIKQLPSVGPGNVLKDLINSNYVKKVILDVVKRQNLLSGILKNANKIINKEIICTCEDTNDAYVIYKEDIKDIQNMIIKYIYEIQSIYNYSIEDIQVLCPQKATMIGTMILNYLLQQEFNKEKSNVFVKNKSFKIKIDEFTTKKIDLNFKKGDKVIHIKNNYDKKWYNKNHLGKYIENNKIKGITNGETGIIEDIVKIQNGSDQITRIIVKYDEGYVYYEDNFGELEHAYALTIHKSQGSQWKAIVIPLAMQNYLMLDNNLLYTAYTRAEEYVAVICQKKALEYATNNSKMINRFTGLKDKIIEYTA